LALHLKGSGIFLEMYDTPGEVRELLSFCTDVAKQMARMYIEAGCDVALHCSGNFDEMADVATAAPILSGESLDRFEHALGCLHDPEPFDEAEALAMVSEAATVRVANIGADPTEPA
jgi:hypothetical protein